MDNSKETIRLQSYLSHSGVSSRREAVQIITEGRVTVDGTVVTEPGYRTSPDACIAVDGEEIRTTRHHAYILLNKPIGYICTNDDPEGRPTAVGLVQPFFSQRLFTVGRLDIQTSGLVLITSDGAFADKVAHPKRGIEKEYTVVTQQEIPESILSDWIRGIRIRNEVYRIRKYSRMGKKTCKIVLTEGKNREIRNVFSHFRITIRTLQRIRIADYGIHDLAPGKFRKLSKDEAYSILTSLSSRGRIMKQNRGTHT